MKKTFATVTVFTAVLLLVIGQYLFLPGWYRDAGVRTSGWLIMLSGAAGILLSIWLLHATIKKLLSGKPIDIFGLAATAQTGARIGAYLMAILSYPFALFLGIIVGGNFGGGFGSSAGDAGTILGIGVGLFVIAAFVGVVAVFIGLVLGGFCEKLARKLQP